MVSIVSDTESGEHHPDPWIKERSFISPKKTHALGYLSIIWNRCEASLRDLFKVVINLSNEETRILVHDMGDISIWAKIIQISEFKNDDGGALQHLKHAEKYYDICRVNRNTFIHAGLTGGVGSDGSALSLSRTKGHQMRQQILDDDLVVVRRVCEECEVANGNVGGLAMYLSWQRDPASREPLALPEKPTLPKLIWTPPAKNYLK